MIGGKKVICENDDENSSLAEDIRENRPFCNNMETVLRAVLREAM